MALHHMLWLKNVLGATIASIQYKNKKSMPMRIEAFIEDKQAWYAIYVVLQCVYPTL